MRSLSLAALPILLLLAPLASAQTFTPARPWLALPCGLQPMSDPTRDEPGALDERDIVGDPDAPAGFSAWDPTYLYLRLRLDADPLQAGKLRPFLWGFQLSLDADPASYELMLVLNGSSGAVEVYRNTTTTQPGDPADPPDQPAALSYPLASHARIAVAEGSSFGGNPDFMISLAVPWADLAPLGLRPLTPALIWAATSSSGNAMNGDLACHHGGQGRPRLDQVGGVPVVVDVTADTDRDQYPDWYEVRFGTDPASADSHPAGAPPAPGTTAADLTFAIEGGGGCRLGATSAGGPTWLLALVALLLIISRRR